MTQVREILAGRYDLLDVLGRGGMGVVYRARDRVLERTVAVKVLPTERGEDPVFVARFEREARAAAALNHPNIVAVFDSGRDGDIRFIVMEFVPGMSLAQRLRSRGPLPASDAAAVASQIASALAAAHRAGIIHRDIKPGNVMVDDQQRVKVLDFGIARAIAYTALTNTASVLGSAPYMAPEVTRGETADERSDIYSLGCVLYEMLTGRPPFTGELGAAVMHQHNTARPRPPKALNPATPAAIDALVTQMLAKEPGQRPQQAARLVELLPSAVAEGPATMLVQPSAAPSTLTDATRVMRRWATAGDRERIALAVAIALLLIGVAVGALGSSGTSRRSAATSQSRTQTAQRPSTSTPAKTSTTPTTSSAGVPTVGAAAGALTTLATQDLQSGGIDQQASQQILSGLQDTLNAYNGGNTSDALQKVDGLATQLTQLGSQGDIRSSALPALTAGVASLRSAIARGAPSTPQSGGAAQPPASPPGKHGKHHGGGGGDQQGD